jgi:hypothetical protein
VTKKVSVFPKELHITHEDEGTDDAYLAVQTNDADIDDGARVAIYALIEIKRKRVTHTLD